MKSKNGVSVKYIRSNEAHDIFLVIGIEYNEKNETPEGFYVERLRGHYLEEDVLNDYTE